MARTWAGAVVLGWSDAIALEDSDTRYQWFQWMISARGRRAAGLKSVPTV